jgi:hypothetical protein
MRRDSVSEGLYCLPGLATALTTFSPHEVRHLAIDSGGRYNAPPRPVGARRRAAADPLVRPVGARRRRHPPRPDGGRRAMNHTPNRTPGGDALVPVRVAADLAGLIEAEVHRLARGGGVRTEVIRGVRYASLADIEAAARHAAAERGPA